MASQGTLFNWNNNLSTILIPQLNNIEEKLLDSYYINHDESQFKIDGESYNTLCACNTKYVRLWPSKHKSQGATDYLNIKSCILTYKKQKINVFKSLKSVFDENVVIA